MSEDPRKRREPAQGTSVPAEEAAAEVLGFVLAGRLERVVDAFLEGQSPEVRAEVTRTTEAVSMLGRAAEPEAPSPALRARVLASVAAGRQRALPRKALVVVDMINDYLTPGRPLEVPRARDVVPALKRRIEEARASGVPVVFVVDRHAPDDPDLDVWGTHAVAGSGGDDVWPELAPQAGDRVVGHPTYSGFARSELDATLRTLQVDTLVLTGCATELQMLATGVDALQRGYAVEVPEDSQAGASAVNEQVALGVLKVTRPYEPARRELLAAYAG